MLMLTILILVSILALSIIIGLLVMMQKQSHLNTGVTEIPHEHEQFLALLSTVNDAVFALDSDGLIIAHNEAARSLSVSEEAFQTKIFSSVLQFDDASGGSVNVLDKLESKKEPTERSDLSIRLSSKESINVRVKVVPVVLGAVHRSAGYLVTIQDITKQKTLDEERNEFVSVTSHEIRTPITIIEGVLSLAMAKKTDINPDLLKLIQQAHDQTIYLGLLVKDLATMAMAEAEFLDIELQPIDAAKLIDSEYNQNLSKAEAKGLKLYKNQSLDVHPILSSPIYVREIVENFISNAILYTKKGSVTIGAEDGADNTVIFWVRDTGIGISQSDKKKLFTKYFRAEDYERRETGGTGLGLYIAKKLAERIGGKVWCSSELGKGSAFYLEIPPIGALKTDAKKVAKAEIEDFANEF